jgi:hypothetical protein
MAFIGQAYTVATVFAEFVGWVENPASAASNAVVGFDSAYATTSLRFRHIGIFGLI